MKFHPLNQMVTALLIAFQYKRDKLEGAIIDLYHAYHWAKTLCSQIYMISDIVEVDGNIIKHAVGRKIVDTGILNFYESPENPENKFVVNNQETFADALKRISLLDERLIVYYSGHGVKDSMVLPDHKLFAYVNFRNLIINNVCEYEEIFWIMDCCNPHGLNFPYVLKGNTFVLNKGNFECFTQPILLITSSNSEQKSVATRNGSLFTRHLFRLLKQLDKYNTTVNTNNRNLLRITRDLVSSIRKMYPDADQNVSIYSSYITDPLLWMWIGNRTDIVVDLSLSVLVIRNFKEEEIKDD